MDAQKANVALKQQVSELLTELTSHKTKLTNQETQIGLLKEELEANTRGLAAQLSTEKKANDIDQQEIKESLLSLTAELTADRKTSGAQSQVLNTKLMILTDDLAEEQKVRKKELTSLKTTMLQQSNKLNNLAKSQRLDSTGRGFLSFVFIFRAA